VDGREYCSTFAAALQLGLPPTGAREKTALWAEPRARPSSDERLTDRQRDLLASLPRWSGPTASRCAGWRPAAW
jgi:hypothetical protein